MIRGNVKTTNKTTIVGQVSQSAPIIAELGRGDHDALLNKNLPDQHNIDAISGLQEIIAEIKQKNSNLQDYITETNLSILQRINNFNTLLAELEKSLDEETARATIAEDSISGKNAALEEKISEVSLLLSSKIVEERQNILLAVSEIETNYVNADNDILNKLNYKADLENGKLKDEQIPFLNIICEIE